MIKDLNKVAIIAGEHRVSFSEMLARVQSFVDAVKQSRGTKTIIFSENREGWIYALYATWVAGGVPVPVDVMSTVSDVEYILRDCTPEYVWASKKKADVMRKAIQQSGMNIRMLIIDDYETAPVSSLVEDMSSPLVKGFDTLYYQNADDMGLIVYTSGTTGTPKGVMLSFVNMLANVRAVSEEVPIYGPEVRSLVLLPLHHILPLMGSDLKAVPLFCKMYVSAQGDLLYIDISYYQYIKYYYLLLCLLYLYLHKYLYRSDYYPLLLHL